MAEQTLLIGCERGLLAWPDRWLIEGAPIWGLAVVGDRLVLAGGRDEAGLWRVEQGRAEQVRDGSYRVFASSLADPQTVFAGALPVDVLRSDDAGCTWRPLAAFHDAHREAFAEDDYVRALALSAARPGVLFAGVEGIGSGGVLVSEDLGETWTTTTQDRDIHGLVCHGSPERLFASSAFGFFVSPDEGATWEKRVFGLEQSYPMPLVCDPLNGQIYLGVADDRPIHWSLRSSGAGSALYRSVTDGRFWEQVLPPDPSPINALACGPDGTVYAGRANGVIHAGKGANLSERGRGPDGLLALAIIASSAL